MGAGRINTTDEFFLSEKKTGHKKAAYIRPLDARSFSPFSDHGRHIRYIFVRQPCLDQPNINGKRARPNGKDKEAIYAVFFSLSFAQLR